MTQLAQLRVDPDNNNHQCGHRQPPPMNLFHPSPGSFSRVLGSQLHRVGQLAVQMQQQEKNHGTQSTTGLTGPQLCLQQSHTDGLVILNRHSLVTQMTSSEELLGNANQCNINCTWQWLRAGHMGRLTTQSHDILICFSHCWVAALRQHTSTQHTVLTQQRSPQNLPNHSLTTNPPPCMHVLAYGTSTNAAGTSKCFVQREPHTPLAQPQGKHHNNRKGVVATPRPEAP
jgi:hypothetical protein